MTLDALGRCLEDALRQAAPAPPPSGILVRAARDILAMAESYCRDGDHFIRTGDCVNGLASFAYGHGWLDCGVRIGLVRATPPHTGTVTIPDRLPSRETDRLMEKSARYQRMLGAAVAAVGETAPPGTPARAAGDAAYRVAAHCLCRARAVHPATHALAVLSYGYGWLDCAVRIGALSAGNRRDLFCI